MRKKNPQQARPFRVRAVPFVSIMGSLFCVAMIISVDATSKIAAGSWMLIGLVVYFLYAKGHSNLNKADLGALESKAGDLVFCSSFRLRGASAEPMRPLCLHPRRGGKEPTARHSRIDIL